MASGGIAYSISPTTRAADRWYSSPLAPLRLPGAELVLSDARLWLP